MSLPKIWNENVQDALNVDVVFSSPEPTEGIGPYQHVIRNGVEKDESNNWIYSWQITDMFSDYVDNEGVTHTKAEQETEYQARLDSEAAERNRNERDRRIAETDWWASSDLTMTAEQTAYRQALRDITTHGNWPHLNDDDWPTKP